MIVHGTCHCGQITFTAEVDPDEVFICHCTDCQRLSASAFRTVVPAPESGFQFLSGTPTEYIKTGDSGRKRLQTFCGTCGSAIYSTTPTGDNRVLGVRVGALDEAAGLAPKEQTWTRSAVPWLDTISDLPGDETQ